MGETKLCRKCDSIKPITDFPRAGTLSGGRVCYRNECKVCNREDQKARYHKNPEKHLQRLKEYRRNFTEEQKQARREYALKLHHLKYESCPQYALRHRYRSNVHMSLTRAEASKHKHKHTIELLGCTFEKFRDYIESLFVAGMSWDNRDEWHLDHIHPVASFDLTDPKQVEECFHYTNMQPLWADLNLHKRDTMPEVWTPPSSS